MKQLLCALICVLGMFISPTLNATKLVGVRNVLDLKAGNGLVKLLPTSDTDREQSIPYSVIRASATDKVISPQPIHVSVYVKGENQDNPYIIRILEGGTSAACVSGKKRIVAEVEGFAQKEACVNTSVPMMIRGLDSLVWKKAFLAIGKNPKHTPGQTGSLPFEFVITPWANTQNHWNTWKDGILKISRSMSGVDFATPLNVIQNDSSWGGGNMPRMKFGTIAHIFNNTPYIPLFVATNQDKAFANNNYTKAVSPSSAVANAMITVPQGEGNALYVFILAAKDTSSNYPPIPENFGRITQAGSTELGPVSIDANEVLSTLEANTPSVAAELTGQNPVEQLTSSNYEQYFAPYYFKIFAQDKNLVVQKCDRNNNSCNQIQSLAGITRPPAGEPNYFELIISNTADNNVTLDVKPITKELALP